MTATTATRRKYRFPDRAAAEMALQAVEQERHLYARLSRAQYRETVQWVGKRGAYRVGLFDFDGGHFTPKVVVVFAPTTGQEPDIRPYDAHEWAENTHREFSQCGFGGDKEAAGLVELADLVSRSLRPGGMAYHHKLDAIVSQSIRADPLITPLDFGPRDASD